MKTRELLTLALSFCAGASVNCIEDFEDDNNTTQFLPMLNTHGETVMISPELKRKLATEELTWHWMPWHRTRTFLAGNVVQEVKCVLSNSSGTFPQPVFSDEQLRKGGFILFVLFGIYAFTLLAIVCNDYFIPCVELICEDLSIPQNVAAATFMAVATSCPEFFVNLISTFITESDMGIGTIIGSAIFNCLGVAAVGGLTAIRPIAIEMRPVTRDVIIYMVNVGVLVAIVWDGEVEWYEAMVLGLLYVSYFVVMFNSMRIFNLIDKIIGKGKWSIPIAKSNGSTPKLEEGTDNKAFENGDVHQNGSSDKVVAAEDEGYDLEDKQAKSIWRYPKEKSILYQGWWLYSFPLRAVLGMTIPSPVTCRKFYPLAFFMCIIWIGVNSYFVTWSVTVIGETFFIPESVMGMTFLAFGGCLPEALSIFIMSRRGEGGMGVSNALGANSLSILFALGVPWLIRTLTMVAQGAEHSAVEIDSTGIGLVVGSLLVAVSCLWITLYFGKCVLRRSVGVVLLCFYILFITFAILVEMGILFNTTLPIC